MTIEPFKPIQDDGHDAFIQMRRVVKTFQTPAGAFRALNGISADFQKGEFVSVVGKSGSGKSTLVNMLTGIDRPTSGEVQIGGTYVHELNESQMARWRGRNLGIVFQFYQLLPTLSLLENVMLPMDFCDMYAPAKREARAMELLKRVGLEGDAHQMPNAVSGGQQQRAAIARALANNPPLIVADEPTGNLDSRTAETVMRIFEELVAQGKTIIMVTHDPHLARRTSRTLLLSDGEVVNEVIAGALPLLTHQQMLKATKSLQRQRFAPGETIIRQGEGNDSFYMIAQGHADVILERAQKAEVTVARLGPKQYFGEVTMLQGGQTTASIMAAREAPIEVVTLDRQIFSELMAEAHRMREAIAHVARQRLAENATLKRGKTEARRKRKGRRGARHAQASLA